MITMKYVLLVKPGVEEFSVQECALSGVSARRVENGMIEYYAEQPIDPARLCFPFWQLTDPFDISAESGEQLRVTDIADEWFRKEIGAERIDVPWSCIWLAASNNGITRNESRTTLFLAVLKKRLSRISKLALTSIPKPGTPARGLFAVEYGNQNRLLLSRNALAFGQQRMKDSPAAPSRSFLKVEEAFTIMGRAPLPGETVVDLGAAPGGWAWAAAKRGATVFAIDNGPLKKAAADHPRIYHYREDAYRWFPEKAVDWLFCDMIDAPHLVLKNVAKWCAADRCRYAIINFKYGHANPVEILRLLQGGKGIGISSTRMICRHLFHDRDEFTMMLER
ncbi:23S rRNA (cytidine2498-2'-O)-methyltransferase [Gammaproteobacteria bacterium]